MLGRQKKHVNMHICKNMLNMYKQKHKQNLNKKHITCKSFIIFYYINRASLVYIIKHVRVVMINLLNLSQFEQEIKLCLSSFMTARLRCYESFLSRNVFSQATKT